MNKMMSLLLALLLVLSLAACGSRQEPEKPWVIRKDDYNYGDHYFAFNDYDTGEDYWAKDLIHADRELETGILYVKNQETGEITQLSTDHVVSFSWGFGNTLVYATDKGELWRSGINGEQQKLLYSSNHVLDKLLLIYKGYKCQDDEPEYVWPKNEVYFLDGSMIVDLDLDTGEATQVTEVDMELFYAFYPWIDGRIAWNNLDGQYRAYNPAAKSIEIVFSPEG